MAKNKPYIEFTKEMLDSMEPSYRGMTFIKRFLSLTNYGRARVTFSKNDLKRWLFPYSGSKPPVVTEILKKYDRASRRNNVK